MNLNAATTLKLLNLANRIIAQYGMELVTILKEATIQPLPTPIPAPPPVPVPMPSPATSLPTNFDEAYYLEKNPDVAAAVGPPPKLFPTGADHWLRHGYMETRVFSRPVSNPTPTPIPTPAPVRWEPKAAYASSKLLVIDLTKNDYDTSVTVDGNMVYSGFGPALRYYTWADGSVRTEDSGQIPLPLPPSPSDGQILDLNP